MFFVWDSLRLFGSPWLSMLQTLSLIRCPMKWMLQIYPDHNTSSQILPMKILECSRSSTALIPNTCQVLSENQTVIRLNENNRKSFLRKPRDDILEALVTTYSEALVTTYLRNGLQIFGDFRRLDHLESLASDSRLLHLETENQTDHIVPDYERNFLRWERRTQLSLAWRISGIL